MLSVHDTHAEDGAYVLRAQRITPRGVSFDSDHAVRLNSVREGLGNPLTVFKATLAPVSSPTGRGFCLIAVKTKWNRQRTSRFV
jgi:hypothetical protein